MLFAACFFRSRLPAEDRIEEDKKLAASSKKQKPTTRCA